MRGVKRELLLVKRELGLYADAFFEKKSAVVACLAFCVLIIVVNCVNGVGLF
jgi:hypothetical protein